MQNKNKEKKFKRVLLICSALLIIASSCSDDEENALGGIPSDKKTKQSSAITISTDFTTNTFQSDVEVQLLKELKLCDEKNGSDTDEKHPNCSPNFFRFFPLTTQENLNNGFILLIKAGVNDFPLRRVLIFQREKGELIKLNGFNGNLIEQRKSLSGYNDLIIRFTDNLEGSLCYYNCVFQWNGGQYTYKNCEAIQEAGQEAPHRIKKEFIDSMAPEIKNRLDLNKMIF